MFAWFQTKQGGRVKRFAVIAVISAMAMIGCGKGGTGPNNKLSAPIAPVLSSPSNGAWIKPTSCRLAWVLVPDAAFYEVQAATSSAFTETVFDQSGITGDAQSMTGFDDGVKYCWRVNASNSSGAGPWSDIWSFTTWPKFVIPQDSIQVNPDGAAPLCAIVKFTSPIACRTQIIVHGKTAGADLSHQFNDSGLYHAVTVAGLYPNYENTVDVLCLLGNDSVVEETTVSITTPALPANMPTSIVTTALQSGDVVEGGNMVSNWSCTQPMIPYFVDDYGDIRWLLNFSGNNELKNLSYECGIARLKNGDYFFGDISSGKIYEVNMLGAVINQWNLPAGYAFHHNVIEKPDGNFIVTVTKAGSTNSHGVSTIEDYVIEIDRTTGAIVNQWDLKVSLDDTRTALSTAAADWFHGNGLVYDSTDNTIIVSGRMQGVVKLNYDNQVQWILAPHRGWGTNQNGINLNTRLLTPLDSTGKPITDTNVVMGWTNNPSFEWNWYQHSPFLMPDGDLLLFDNGSSRNFNTTATTQYSRAVEFKIDPVAMTVQQIWTYGKERGNATFSTLFSRVEYLPQKNHILFCPGYDVPNAVAGGYGGKIIEVDYATKVVVLEMEISVNGGISFHRADRMDLYP